MIFLFPKIASQMIRILHLCHHPYLIHIPQNMHQTPPHIWVQTVPPVGCCANSISSSFDSAATSRCIFNPHISIWSHFDRVSARIIKPKTPAEVAKTPIQKPSDKSVIYNIYFRRIYYHDPTPTSHTFFYANPGGFRKH